MKQPDEMEKTIRLQSQALSFKITLLLLSFWTIWESCAAFLEKQRADPVPGYILVAAVLFESVYEQFLKHRMVQGDEEYKEPNRAFRMVIGIAVAAAIILSVGSILMVR